MELAVDVAPEKVWYFVVKPNGAEIPPDGVFPVRRYVHA
jgi:hypothetical protein